ncbi:MAG: flagellar motor switch protein FliM [Alphaproteobacteria bacterium]
MSDDNDVSDPDASPPDDAGGAGEAPADDIFADSGVADDDVAFTDDGLLHQDEIDDIFGISMDEEAPTTGIEALLNSNRIQHKRVPLLEACIYRLVRVLNASLRNFTSEEVEVNLVDTSSVRFGNYIDTIPLPALISVFRATEWNGCGLISVDSPLIYSILDALLGGRRSAMPLSVEGRSFTVIEVTLIERMIDLILKEMSIAFKPLADVAFVSERMESNPSLVTIAYPTDTAIMFRIDVEMDSRGGSLEVLIPYPTLEPVQHLLKQMFMGEKFGRDAVWEAHWTDEMMLTDIEVEVSLGEQIVPLSELMSLQVGSTLQLNKKPQEPATLRCGGIPLLRGKVGKVGDRIALQVDNWISKAQRQALTRRFNDHQH